MISTKELAKQAKIDAKEAAKQAKLDTKKIAKQAKIDEKEAVKQAKLDEKAKKEVDDKHARQFTLKERITWALTIPQKLTTQTDITMQKQKENEQEKEKIWGNSMIGQTNNGQWTTLLGENLVYDVLAARGENPRKVERKDGFQPDWETDGYMYEVKTSNWWVDGTAGEKVLGTWIKYQNVPEIYGKPLRIVCVANQEEELTNGKTRYFGENIYPKTKQILDLAKSWKIEYIRFSDLVSTIT